MTVRELVTLDIAAARTGRTDRTIRSYKLPIHGHDAAGRKLVDMAEVFAAEKRAASRRVNLPQATRRKLLP